MLRINGLQRSTHDEPVVITGIGLITSVGLDRESSCARSATVRAVCGCWRVCRTFRRF